jgi:hypothetical protein
LIVPARRAVRFSPKPVQRLHLLFDLDRFDLQDLLGNYLVWERERKRALKEGAF